MKGDAGEVRDDDVPGNLVHAPLAREVLNVAEGLGFGFAEIAAKTFVFDQHFAGPEEVDESVLAGDLSYGLLEAGDDAASDAENFEKFVPEGLLFGLFAFDASPLVGKRDGAIADFIPREGHGWIVTKACGLFECWMRRVG